MTKICDGIEEERHPEEACKARRLEGRTAPIQLDRASPLGWRTLETPPPRNYPLAMEPAYKLLTVEEFLDSCPNDDRHYQLCDGLDVPLVAIYRGAPGLGA